MKWPIIRQVPDEHPWVTYWRRQVHRRNNCVNAIATGTPGSGKSWSLLYLLSQADPTFTIDRVFFKASEMIRWIDKGGLTRGTAFMLDEGGIDANSKQWWTEVNTALNFFYQTGRSDNYISGISVPFLSEISKGVRKYMNCRVNAEGYDQKNNLTFATVHHVEYNGDLDKFYRKRLLVITEKGSQYCDKVVLPKADRCLIAAYEKKKKEFKRQLYKKLGDGLEKHESKALGEPQPLNPEEQMVKDLLEQGYTALEGADKMGITVDMFRNRKQMIKKKNHVINEPKKRERYVPQRAKSPINP